MADNIIKLSQEEFVEIFSDEFVEVMNNYISFWKLPDYIYLMFRENMQFLSLYDMSNGDYSVEFTEFTNRGNEDGRPYNNHDKMKVFRGEIPFKYDNGRPRGQFHFQEPYVRIP